MCCYLFISNHDCGGLSLGHSYLEEADPDLPVVVNMFLFTVFMGGGAALGAGFGAIYPVSIPIACVIGFTRYREKKRLEAIDKRYGKH